MNEREARVIIKNAKMLIHYYHHFGECKNVMFDVRGKVTANAFSTRVLPFDVEVASIECRLFPAKEQYYNAKTKETKRLTSDVDKLLNYIKFNPDIIIENENKVGNQILFNIVSVDPILNSIRTDFFK